MRLFLKKENLMKAGLVAGLLMSAPFLAQAATISPASGLDLRNNAINSNSVQVYSEKSGVEIGSDMVTVDYLVGTNLQAGVSTKGVDTFTTGLSLGAGTYDSFLVHFDPIVTGGDENRVIDFGADIVGLIVSNYSDNDGPRLLNLSDSIFGTAAQYENGSARRTERHDRFTLTNATTLTVSLFADKNLTDNIRVLVASDVAPVPIPATLPLLLVGFGGFALLRRKRA